MEEEIQQDICRVCRSEGSVDRPLFHPCICMGSIKFIHQECLTQWLRYSRKEYCELCNHRFSFTPIYSPDMPTSLPVLDIVSGLMSSVCTAVRFWLHYTLVALAWLGVVPLTACRIYRCLFSGSLNSLLSLPVDMLSTENLVSDGLQGCLVVTCTLCAFISLVWMREQIMLGGEPDWIDQQRRDEQHVHDQELQQQQQQQPGDDQDVQNAVLAGDGGGDRGDVARDIAGDDAADHDQGGHEAAGDAPPAAAAGAGGENDEAAAGVGADNQWNPMAVEWERGADEVTWERLLGLDGSLVFLEHVFWVVSLNTLFIFVLAFCPYHIGSGALSACGVHTSVDKYHFSGVLTTLVGYCVVGAMFVLLHSLTCMFSLRRAQRVLGVCYVVVKVVVLAVLEIGVFPLVCGWWLDVCSLQILGTTLHKRRRDLARAPGTYMFMYWLAGAVYVFYFASIVLVLREVLRPGVLWFLRNLNDPDFNPIQDMIHLCVARHLRRFLASVLTFGMTVFIMVWLPANILATLAPGFLPYNVSTPSEGLNVEPSLQLLVLQVFLPALLEQKQPKIWLKNLIRWWCIGVSSFTGLRSYLLGDMTLNDHTQPDDDDQDNAAADADADADVDVIQHVPAQPAVAAQQDGGLAALHQGMMARTGSIHARPYQRPSHLAARVLLLTALAAVTLMLSSCVMLSVPVWLGRRVLAVCAAYSGDSAAGAGGSTHELYTALCGLYLCWMLVRVCVLAGGWWQLEWRPALGRLREWTNMAGRTLLSFVLLVGVVPLLYGVLLELVVVIPLRVPLNQTPIFFLSQTYVLGILYTKITCALTWMGPNWWLKAAIEQVYLEGVREMRLRTVVVQLWLPLAAVLSLALSLPYCLVHSILPLFVRSELTLLFLQRNIYALLVSCAVASVSARCQYRQFKRLYEHIKNDKYLVGRRLVNYDPEQQQHQQQQQQDSDAQPHADLVAPQ